MTNVADIQEAIDTDDVTEITYFPPNLDQVVINTTTALHSARELATNNPSLLHQLNLIEQGLQDLIEQLYE